MFFADQISMPTSFKSSCTDIAACGSQCPQSSELFGDVATLGKRYEGLVQLHIEVLTSNLTLQVTRDAAERDEEDRQRFQWIVGVGYRANQLVFVDESAADRRTTRRGFAWSPIGNRARIRDPLNRGLR